MLLYITVPYNDTSLHEFHAKYTICHPEISYNGLVVNCLWNLHSSKDNYLPIILDKHEWHLSSRVLSVINDNGLSCQFYHHTLNKLQYLYVLLSSILKDTIIQHQILKFFESKNSIVAKWSNWMYTNCPWQSHVSCQYIFCFQEILDFSIWCKYFHCNLPWFIWP